MTPRDLTRNGIAALIADTKELVAEWPSDMQRRYWLTVKDALARGAPAYEAMRDAYNGVVMFRTVDGEVRP